MRGIPTDAEDVPRAKERSNLLQVRFLHGALYLAGRTKS
jgi:hypothetical protein